VPSAKVLVTNLYDVTQPLRPCTRTRR
jgi:hypothetical protein